MMGLSRRLSSGLVRVVCCLQMCRTVNDVEQVRLALSTLPKTLKFDDITASIHESQVRGAQLAGLPQVVVL